MSDLETQSRSTGFTYKYQGAGPTQGVQAIIYVYNLRVKNVPTRLQSPMLAQIRQLTRREILQQAEMQSLIARPVFGNTLSLARMGAFIQAAWEQSQWLTGLPQR